MSNIKTFTISAQEEKIDDLLTFLEEAEITDVMSDYTYSDETIDRIYTSVNEISLDISEQLQG